MKLRFLLPILPACLALLQTQAMAQDASPEPLEVFLQGGNAQELRALVEASGGTVTHDLHIIDAVGARLSAAQLEQVIQSPLVGRYFDDLAITGPPEDGEQAKDSCDVDGSLELDFSPAGISWRLYNKQGTPAILKRLELQWPEQLGSAKSLSLGKEAIAIPPQTEGASNFLTVEFPDTIASPAPRLTETAALAINFHPGAAPASGAKQDEFELKVDFTPDCSVELIPAYANNHENFYYNQMAGVEALHLHGITGKGVTVAVIDSGLWEHPDLARDTSGKNRIVARYDAITDTTPDEVFDASGHGTHMTSVIAHSGATTQAGAPTGTFKGVAPDVNLVSVKAFDVAGQGGFLDIVRAVQWVVDNRETYNIKVLNLSFSARPRWHYWLDPINQAVMRAWASGITVVAAAGNEGPEPMTIGSPGNLPYIITVGAVTDSWTPNDRDDDYIPEFSSRGPTPNAHIKPDLVAPGGHITGLTRPGSGLTDEHPEYILSSGEFVMTGSSQASALVSGIAALLLQLEPGLTPDDVKCKLMSSAEPAINDDGLLAYSPFQQGHGQVNATRAVTLGQSGCGNIELDIAQEIAGAGHFTGPAIVEADGIVSLPGLSGMVSPEPAAAGHSDIRRWGVKDHIERQDISPAGTAPEPAASSPFNWIELYLEEKSAIESLSKKDQQ